MMLTDAAMVRVILIALWRGILIGLWRSMHGRTAGQTLPAGHQNAAGLAADPPVCSVRGHSQAIFSTSSCKSRAVPRT